MSKRNKFKFFRRLLISTLPIIPVFSSISLLSNNEIDEIDNYKTEQVDHILSTLKNKIAELYSQSLQELKNSFPTKAEYEKNRYYQILNNNFSIIENSLKKYINNDFDFLKQETYFSRNSISNEESKIINTLSKDERINILSSFLNRINNVYITDSNWLTNPSNFPIYGYDFNLDDKEMTDVEKSKIDSIIFNLENQVRNFNGTDFIAYNIQEKLREHIYRDRNILMQARNENKLGIIKIKPEALEKSAFNLKKSDIYIENPNPEFKYTDEFIVKDPEITQSNNGRTIDIRAKINLNNVFLFFDEHFDFKYSFLEYENLLLNNYYNNLIEQKRIYLKDTSKNKNFDEITESDFYSFDPNDKFNFEINSIQKHIFELERKDVLINFTLTSKIDPNSFEIIAPNQHYLFQKKGKFLYEDILLNKIQDINLADELPLTLTDKGKEITASNARFYSPLEQIAYVSGDTKGFDYKIKKIVKKADSDGTIGIAEVEISNGEETRNYFTEITGFKKEEKHIKSDNPEFTQEDKDNIYNNMFKENVDVLNNFLNKEDLHNLTEEQKAALFASAFLFSENNIKNNISNVIEEVENNPDFSNLTKQEKTEKIEEILKNDYKELFEKNKNLLDTAIGTAIDGKAEKIKNVLENNNKIDSEIAKSILDKLELQKNEIKDILKKESDPIFDEKIKNIVEQIDDQTKKILADNAANFIKNLNPLQIKKVKNSVELGILWSIVTVGSIVSLASLMTILFLIFKRNKKIKQKLTLLLSSGVLGSSTLVFVIYILLELMR
ncbi:hypothetical protein ACR34G_02045 [Mycoplasma sp. 480]|uniref:hypothetical protein n=1 Tax=Mycoplasma sp. 480 TaxID=3440155 RepID=UPI003F50F385